MSVEQRFLIILNPVAAMGRAGQRRNEIEALLAAQGLRYELRLSERIGHARELARNAGAEGFAAVVAAGGDGTVNEVINGLMAAHAGAADAGSAGAGVAARPDASDTAFGVLSVGRGNDFAYGAGIPSTLEDCVAILAKGNRRPLDVGMVTGGDYPGGKYFGNGIGIGFDTIVGLQAAKMKHVHGFMAYVLGALKTFILYPQAPLVKVRLDGGREISQKSHQISIMNGKRMGGTFFMAPQADIRDGFLDLCMAGELNRRAMASLMGRYIHGTQAEHPSITIDRSTRFSVEALEGGLIVHADGETVCVDGASLAVECIPGALSILCP